MQQTETLGTKELVLGREYDSGQAYLAAYLQEIICRGLPHERRATWDTTAANIDDLLDCALASANSQE